MTTEGNLLDLGLRDYIEVLDLQRKLVDLRGRNAIPDTLILVEHPHVFTVGKGVQGELRPEINNIPVVRIERGGHWTYHGPGQLVGYPILDLDARNRDIHEFLRNLEETIIVALANFGISAGRGDQTGVWVQKKKIASIGAAVRNWVSLHGFALNVNTDMTYFTYIEPCEMPASAMTSMQAILGKKADFNAAKQEIRRSFEKVFDVEMKEHEPLVTVGSSNTDR